MTAEIVIEKAFPELGSIEDESLRASVIDAWMLAIEENDIESLESVPWLPTMQSTLELEDETLVEHTRDVTAATVGLADAIVDRRDEDLWMDGLIAAALTHDVSQLAEFDDWNPTNVYDLIGHPYYAIYIMERVKLPVAVQHAVLAHTPFSNVEPATLEAVILNRADYAVARAVRWRVYDDLREAP